jgi:hypothetical protein
LFTLDSVDGSALIFGCVANIRCFDVSCYHSKLTTAAQQQLSIMIHRGTVDIVLATCTGILVSRLNFTE